MPRTLDIVTTLSLLVTALSYLTVGCYILAIILAIGSVFYLGVTSPS